MIDMQHTTRLLAAIALAAIPLFLHGQNVATAADGNAKTAEVRPLIAKEPRKNVPLFDGRTFDGWEGDTAKTFRIEDGVRWSRDFLDHGSPIVTREPHGGYANLQGSQSRNYPLEAKMSEQEQVAGNPAPQGMGRPRQIRYSPHHRSGPVCPDLQP